MSIYWNGVSSATVNLVVEKYPAYNRPSKKYTQVAVAGRNGDLFFDEGAYNNIIQAYDCYVSCESSKLPAASKAVADWLYSPTGYAKLYDDYDATTYRLAYYAGETDISNVLNKYGRCTLEFNCKPQRFLASGDTAITMTSGHSYTNSGKFDSYPIWTITGTGNCVMSFGGQTVTLTGLTGGAVLDAETGNATYNGTNINSKVSGTIPLFKYDSGNAQSFTLTSGFTATCKPRWWIL